MFTVWVGGVEVNDYYMSIEDATDLAAEYVNDKYDDVYIQPVFV